MKKKKKLKIVGKFSDFCTACDNKKTQLIKEQDGGGGVAFATLNSNGMGNVVAPQASSTPGYVGGSTIGSGDIANGYSKYSKSSYSPRKDKKGKRKKLNKLGKIKYFTKG